MTEDDVGRVLNLALDRFGTEVDTEPLMHRIRAELQAVERVAGPAEVTDSFVSRWPLPNVLHLTRPIAVPPVTSPPSSSISLLVEWRTLASAPVMLAADDYRQLDAWRLLRLADGTNGSSCWGVEVLITYQAHVDQDLRDRVVLDLVALDAAFSPLRRVTLPDYSEDSGGDHEARRREILAQLTSPSATVL